MLGAAPSSRCGPKHPPTAAYTRRAIELHCSYRTPTVLHQSLLQEDDGLTLAGADGARYRTTFELTRGGERVSLRAVVDKAAWYSRRRRARSGHLAGVQSHGQPRYVFIATALLVVLGVDALARCRWARPRVALRWSRRPGSAWSVATPLFYRHVDGLRAPMIDAARRSARTAVIGRARWSPIVPS